MDLTKLRKALDDAKAESARTYKAFTDARDAASAEGADFTDEKGEAFVKLEGIHKEHAIAAQKASELEHRYVGLLEMSADGPKSEEARETKAGAAPFATPGDRFIASAVYETLVKSGLLEMGGARINVPAAKVLDRAELKTLITGLSSTSAGAFVINDMQAGYVDIERKPRRMLDLVTLGDTDSDMVDYVKVTSRTNNAAETAEATSSADGAAPESAIAFAVSQAAVKEVKHFIPATKRSLADVGQLRTIIDQELTVGLFERLDTQLATGDGSGENLTGILSTAGIQSQAIGSDSLVDAIHKAITKVRLAYYEPDALAIHPSDWESIRLSKDANGQYLFGPPSVAGPLSVWGLGVTPTVAITAANPLVGSFKRGATFWLRSGAQIAATDSHDDWFIRGIVAVLASMRGAFAVQRPTAFCEVTA